MGFLIGPVYYNHRSSAVKGIRAAPPPLTASSAMIRGLLCRSGNTAQLRVPAFMLMRRAGYLHHWGSVEGATLGSGPIRTTMN